MPSLTEAFGERLRWARRNRGLTIQQLATRLPSGIGYDAVRSYELGTRSMTVERAAELCDALGLDLASVYRWAIARSGGETR